VPASYNFTAKQFGYSNKYRTPIAATFTSVKRGLGWIADQPPYWKRFWTGKTPEGWDKALIAQLAKEGKETDSHSPNFGLPKAKARAFDPSTAKPTMLPSDQILSTDPNAGLPKRDIFDTLPASLPPTATTVFVLGHQGKEPGTYIPGHYSNQPERVFVVGHQGKEPGTYIPGHFQNN